ncbi:MAG: glycosyltransferase [Lentisphaerae bacterium]|nr:glycosyltransferase [Lentisphaerota bacterium]
MNFSRTKIGWVLSGSDVVPGARIQGFNAQVELHSMGVESEILIAPRKYSLSVSESETDWKSWIKRGFTTIVFQKVFAGDAVRLVGELRNAGIRTVYMACDLCGHNMVDACDVTIAVSSFLKKMFGRRRAGKIQVVPDGLEVSADKPKQQYRFIGTSPVKAVYVGSAFPSPEVLGMLAVLEQKVDLTIIASRYEPHLDISDASISATSAISKLEEIWKCHPLDILEKALRKCVYVGRSFRGRVSAVSQGDLQHRFVEWDKNTVATAIVEHDVALIPAFLASDHDMAKSSNRLTMFMALGMPVIASPVPSYTEIVRNGENGFIAGSRADWLNALQKLTEPGIAERIGQCARANVIETFSLKRTVETYLAVFRGDTIAAS